MSIDQSILIITDGLGARVAGVTVEENTLIVLDGPPGPRGPAGGGVGSEPLRFDFVGQSTWTMAHNLGRNPVVDLYTVGGVRMIGAVQHINTNIAVATFDGPFAGYALII